MNEAKEYYSEHPDQVEFIKRFMDVGKAGVFRARHLVMINGGHIQRDTRPWMPRYTEGLYGYTNTSSVLSDLMYARTLYWYNYIWYDEAKVCNDRVKKRDGSLVAGLTPLFDVDSLSVPGMRRSVRRIAKDDHETLEVFELTRLSIRDELKSWGLWDGSRMMWSGNGYYVILEDYYADFDDISDYGDAIVDMQNDINKHVSNEFGEEVIDIKRAISKKYKVVSWQRFNKVPYTYHNTANDLSYPIDKEQDMTVSLKINEVDWNGK